MKFLSNVLNQFLVDVWNKGHFVLLPCSCVHKIVAQETSGDGAISCQAVKFWSVGTSGPVGLNSRVVVTSTWLGVVTNRLAKSLTGETLQHSEINKLQLQTGYKLFHFKYSPILSTSEIS